MKKIVGSLLSVALCSSATFATQYQQRTYLAPRAVGVNLPMETALVKPHHDTKGDRHDLHLNVTPFYSQSVNTDDLGRYFGFGNGSHVTSIGNPGANPAPWLNGAYLIHDATAGAFAGATLSLKPRQEVFGVRFDGRYEFNELVEGLSFWFGSPLVWLKNDLRAKFTNSTPVVRGGKSLSIQDFFAGKVDTSTDAADRQAPLKYGKIGKSHSAVGFGDLAVGLAYSLIDKHDTLVELSGNVIVPTGNTPKAEYLFEPVYGNGNHFGIGAGIDASVTLWKDHRGRLLMHGAACASYLFEAREHRLPGIAYNADRKFNHYALVGRVGDDVLQPAANFLAQDLHVKPGNQAEGVLDLNFVGAHFSASVGYGLFWKDQESVHQKNSGATGAGLIVPNTDRAITAPRPDGTPTNVVSAAPADGIMLSSTYTDFSAPLHAARTPTQVTHTFFGGLGYSFNIDERPVLLGVGGAYELAQDNSSLEQFNLWAKVGVSF